MEIKKIKITPPSERKNSKNQNGSWSKNNNHAGVSKGGSRGMGHSSKVNKTGGSSRGR